MRELLRTRRGVAEAAYVIVVGVLAAAGFTTGSTAAILLAALLALPSSVPALVGYYVAYGLLAQVPGANPSSSSGSASCPAAGPCQDHATGGAAAWLTVTTGALGVLALVAAAVLNVVLLRKLGRRTPKTPHS